MFVFKQVCDLTKRLEPFSPCKEKMGNCFSSTGEKDPKTKIDRANPHEEDARPFQTPVPTPPLTPDLQWIKDQIPVRWFPPVFLWPCMITTLGLMKIWALEKESTWKSWMILKATGGWLEARKQNRRDTFHRIMSPACSP